MDMTFDMARRVVDAMREAAQERGVPSAYAVVDKGGNLVIFEVDDDVILAAREIAINKAFTAACHRRPTHTYTNAQPGQEAFGIMNMHGGRFSIFVGGWPIEVDGEVVGGIGVSGGHTKEDIACCKAGIEALMSKLGKSSDFAKWDNWAPPSPTA